MKNYLWSSFVLLLIVMAVLTGMHFLPQINLFGHTMRQVDLLADLRNKLEAEDSLEIDSLLLPKVKPLFVDTCKSGLTCIEDYADSTRQFGMDHFYEALGKIKQMDRPVRIAYFGDSFIEADILTGDLRSMLQSEYGGCGVGYVPITYTMTGFRPTIHYAFNGWESHFKIDTIGFRSKYQDIAGNYFFPNKGAYVLLKGEKKYAPHLDTCEVSTIYFRSFGNIHLTSTINGKKRQSFTIKGDGQLQKVSVTDTIGRIQWAVADCDSATFYGVAMESRQGICLDNLANRGSSGVNLTGIPMKMLQETHRERPYDLLVLQYGLNVAQTHQKDYTTYQEEMKEVIDHLKTAFPDVSILLISIGDREYNRSSDGELHTMPGVKNLIRFQQAIAAENNIAFWNLYEAMGGEGSIVEMVDKHMANLDYTHINFKGGKHLAGIFFETIKYGKEQYDKRKAYEAE